MAENSWNEWLIKNILRKGVVVKTISPTDAYANQNLTIVGVELDTENLLNSTVKVKLEKKVHGKKSSTPKAWWILERTYPVKVE